MKPRLLFILSVFFGLGAHASFAAEPATQAKLDQWVFPTFSWKEPDFQNRFLGRYGVNGYTEPLMDVENFNLYEATMALAEDKPKAIAYLQNGIQALNASGIKASAALSFVLANLLYESGDKEGATIQYIEAIRLHPSFLRAYSNLGYSLMETGQNEKALPVLLKAVELGDTGSQIHGLIGRIYTEKKLYESGLTAFRTAMMFNPDNNAWRSGALQCLIGLNRWDEALTLADELIAFDRRLPTNWINRASLLLHRERTDEAIVDLQVAHTLGGATFETQMLLSALYFNKGLYQQSAATLTTAIALADTTEACTRLLTGAENLAEANQSDDAMTVVAAIEAHAQSKRLTLDTGKLNRITVRHEWFSGNFARALALLDPLIEQAPADGELLLLKARSLNSLGQPDEALLAYQIATTIPATVYAACYESARLELGRQNVPAAIKLLRQAYDLKPTDQLLNYLRELSALEVTSP